MHKFRFSVFSAAILVLASATAQAGAAEEDPFIALEDIYSESSLDWARKQNARSLAALKNESAFEAMRNEALEILT